MSANFLSRPKDRSLQSYKDWIMGIALRFDSKAKDNLSEEEWIARWKAFWNKADLKSEDGGEKTGS